MRRIGCDLTDPGLEHVANPGITWGGGIIAQGLGWEDALERDFGLAGRLPAGFQTFDFYDELSKTATSARTLDTMARTHTAYPQEILRRFQGYVDRVATFQEHRRFSDLMNAQMIDKRRLELAIPAATSPEQMMHVRHALEYAAERGIEVEVTLIQ